MIIKHCLNVDLAYKPMVHKKRHMGIEQCALAADEVQKLLCMVRSGMAIPQVDINCSASEET